MNSKYINEPDLSAAVGMLVELVNSQMTVDLMAVNLCFSLIEEAKAHVANGERDIKTFAHYKDLSKCIKSLNLFINLDTMSLNLVFDKVKRKENYINTIRPLFNQALTNRLKSKLTSGSNEIWSLKTSSYGESNCEILSECVFEIKEKDPRCITCIGMLAPNVDLVFSGRRLTFFSVDRGNMNINLAATMNAAWIKDFNQKVGVVDMVYRGYGTLAFFGTDPMGSRLTCQTIKQCHPCKL